MNCEEIFIFVISIEKFIINLENLMELNFTFKSAVKWRRKQLLKISINQFATFDNNIVLKFR